MHKVLLNLTFLGESLFDPLANKVRGTLSPGNYCKPELGPVNRPQTKRRSVSTSDSGILTDTTCYSPAWQILSENSPLKDFAIY